MGNIIDYLKKHSLTKKFKTILKKKYLDNNILNRPELTYVNM